MADFQKIVRAQAQRVDQELFEACPFLEESFIINPLLEPSVETSPSPSSNDASPDIRLPPIFTPMDNRNQSKESQPKTRISTESGINRQTIIPRILQPEIEAFQSSSQSEFVAHRPRIRKRTQTYETNNLLPFARKPHLQFLEERLQKRIYSFKIINKLMAANTATRQDFLELYSIPEFYDAFEDFFTNGVLYRAVMISACKMKNKKIFLSRLNIFQKAYRTKIFNVVNRRDKRTSSNKIYGQV